MTDTPKPPMVIWLQNQQSLDIEQWHDYDVTWCRDKIFKHDVGPYVHLDKFLAEVERRAQRLSFPTLDNDDDHTHQAMQELAREIKEGKRESWKHC